MDALLPWQSTVKLGTNPAKMFALRQFSTHYQQHKMCSNGKTFLRRLWSKVSNF